MAPDPIIHNFFGRNLGIIASLELQIKLEKLMSPIVLGLQPVAIIIFLEEISSVVVLTKNSLSIFLGYARCL